jgi:carbon monoxide dehydrogenase subunit G
MPHYSRSETVDAPPAAVFAILDDVTRAPEWLKRCTQLDNVSGGPVQVGTKLRYHYRDGGRTGVMDGEVVAREPERKLTNHFVDRMMDVTVDFDLEPGSGPGQTRLTHTITIRTKGLGRVLTPVINRQLPAQTESAMTELKRLAEAAS